MPPKGHADNRKKKKKDKKAITVPKGERERQRRPSVLANCLV